LTDNHTFGVANYAENPLALRPSQDPRNRSTPDPKMATGGSAKRCFVRNGTAIRPDLPGADLFYDGSGQRQLLRPQ